MTSRKKLLSALLLIIGFLLGVFLAQKIYFYGKNTIVVGELSRRAQEFVDTQRLDTASAWQSKNLLPASAAAEIKPEQLQQTPCFSINVPLPIRTVYARESTACTIQVRLKSPPAKLTIVVESFAKPLSEYSAVQMRETITDSYTLEPFSTSQYSQTKTFSDPQGISFFAHFDGKIVAVVFSETQSQDSILAEYLPKVLEVLMVY